MLNVTCARASPGIRVKLASASRFLVVRFQIADDDEVEICERLYASSENLVDSCDEASLIVTLVQRLARIASSFFS